MKKQSKFFFIFACAVAGLSLGIGMGFAVAGLIRYIGLTICAIGTLFSLVLFALAVIAIAFIGLAAHRRDLNAKVTAPYFAKPTRVKDLAHAESFSKKYRHAKVLVLSYYDPKKDEKGGSLYEANINSAIEAFFPERALYFIAPNRFIFFALAEEEQGYLELFDGLNRKLKKRDPSLRLYIGIGKDEVGHDFLNAYDQALAALYERYAVKETLSCIHYEELEDGGSALAGLSPIEMVYQNKEGNLLRVYPYGYNGTITPLSFLGGLGLSEAYKNASLGLAKEKLSEGEDLVGIYFSPTSFHTSSIYLSVNHIKDKKRLVVFFPATAGESKLAYASSKIKRMGCRIGYYGVNETTPLSSLDLEGGYLLLDPSFYEEEPSIVKSKKNLFASRGAITVGQTNEAYSLRKEEGGER